jgi:hypothetical protein
MCVSDRYLSGEEAESAIVNQRVLLWMKAARNHRQQDVG